MSDVEAEGRAVARAAARNRMTGGRGGDGKCLLNIRWLIRSYAKILKSTRGDAVSNVQKCALAATRRCVERSVEFKSTKRKARK